MNREIIVHPRLHHYGLTTGNLKDMVDWYGKVLGMTVNQHAKIPSIARLMRQGPPFSAFAFVSNDEMDHRIVFFLKYRRPNLTRTNATILGCNMSLFNARQLTSCWAPISGSRT